LSGSAGRVLNVGGGSREIAMPPQYADWQRVFLDIDPAVAPDVVCDARELTKLAAAEYDAVYCAHNLEHYYAHDVPKVLAGFRHVLKPQGFAHVVVPDLQEVFASAVEKKLDIEDVLYVSALGPITVRDVIYGWGREIERSGNDFYAHKTGFTEKSLRAALYAAGFTLVYTRTGNTEIQSLAFIRAPGNDLAELFGLPASAP